MSAYPPTSAAKALGTLAATLGLGPDLASCLTKITQFMGQPSTWIGIDRHLLTHPSLEERTARLLNNP